VAVAVSYLLVAEKHRGVGLGGAMSKEQASIQDYPVGHTDLLFAKRLEPDAA
jgi:hypothetical protein